MNLLLTTTRTFKLPRFRLHIQEGGLLVVIFVLGGLLTLFGGTVRVPLLQENEQGEIERVFRTNAEGQQEMVFIEKNKFLNAQNLTKLAKDTSFIAVMAIGVTFVIISGGIDLSIGAAYALASVFAALVFQQFGSDGSLSHVSPWLSVPSGIAVCLLTGAVCGLFNGGMIVALRVHPFIITLGTMAIFRGIAFVTTQGQSVGDFPQVFREMVRWEAGQGLTVIPMAVMLLVAILASLYLTRMAPGRRIYAVGGNELASRYSGIRVHWVKLSVFMFSGLTAGIAALLALGYYGAASSADGTGYELHVIAAAVVGGASLSGGKGSAFGALLGALVIEMISTGIVILGIDQNYSQIIIGGVVILAVVLDQFNQWLAKQRLAARAGTA